MLKLLRSTWVKKTRKPCRCNTCYRLFPIGSTMLKEVWIDKDLSCWNTCQTCEEIIHQMFQEGWLDISNEIDPFYVLEYVSDKYGSFESADKALLEAME